VFVRVGQGDGEGSSLRFLTGRRSTRSLETIFLVLACLVGAAYIGCAKSVDRSPSILMRHEISPQPPRVGPDAVTIRLSDTGGKPVTAAQIAIEADMSHPGMSPAFGQAKELEAGRYQGQIDFAMAGDWILLFHITLADGRKLDRQVSVPAVRPN
jgi:hypothetical protein